jgi:hypothetical protein
VIDTDFKTHHIEGIAREGNTPFKVPLITQIDDTLWQGGCINGVDLKGQFKHIVSLYPWERYNPGGELHSFVEVRLYDCGDIPSPKQLKLLARWINDCRKTGTTLVHCQAGLNRSGLLTGLALVLGGMMPVDAIQKMRESRCPAVLCNKAFEAWLLKQKPGKVRKKNTGNG